MSCLSESNSNKDVEFISRARDGIAKASALNTDALVFIGGNPENCDVRQKLIFDVVNESHRKGIVAYWYRTAHNARLDITDQIIPGLSYVLMDLDVMSISDAIVQSAVNASA